MSNLLSYLFPLETKAPRQDREIKVQECDPKMEDRSLPPLPSLPPIDPSDQKNVYAISRRLLPGETISVYVGPEAVKFEPTLHQVQYHCKSLRKLVDLDHERKHFVLHLHDQEDLEVWCHLQHFMQTGQLDPTLRPPLPKSPGAEKTVLFLCKMWLSADHLGMVALQFKIEEALGKNFGTSRQKGSLTALTSATLAHVLKGFSNEENLKASPLWNILLLEIGKASGPELGGEKVHTEDFENCLAMPVFGSSIQRILAEPAARMPKPQVTASNLNAPVVPRMSSRLIENGPEGVISPDATRTGSE